MRFPGNRKLVLSIAVNVVLVFVLSMLLYLVYPQFIYELDSVSHWGRYSVRTYRNYERGTAYFEVLMGPAEYLRQPQVPRRIYSYSGEQAFYVEVFGTDVTGDGAPNLVVRQWEGSAHGDSRYLVLELDGSAVTEIDVIDGLLDVKFQDLDNDGTPEVTGVDKAYSYFGGDSFAASPRPLVVLSFDKTVGRFVPDKRLMSKPPLSRDRLNELGLKYRQDARRSKQSRSPSQLFGAILELIYSGNEAQARELFDASWPDEPGIPKERYEETMKGAAGRSPFYPIIAAWNKKGTLK
jgi:hypothetical protein